MHLIQLWTFTTHSSGCIGVAVMCTKQLFKAVFPMHTDQQKLDDLLDFFDIQRNNLCVHGCVLR